MGFRSNNKFGDFDTQSLYKKKKKGFQPSASDVTDTPSKGMRLKNAAKGVDIAKNSSPKLSSGQMAAAKMGGDLAGDMIDEGGTTTDSAAGAGGGALKGLAAGASTGNPYAAVAGAVIGGVSGALKARSARKKAQAEAEADTQEGLARIAKDKGDRLRNEFSRLGQIMQIGPGLGIKL